MNDFGRNCGTVWLIVGAFEYNIGKGMMRATSPSNSRILDPSFAHTSICMPDHRIRNLTTFLCVKFISKYAMRAQCACQNSNILYLSFFIFDSTF